MRCDLDCWFGIPRSMTPMKHCRLRRRSSIQFSVAFQLLTAGQFRTMVNRDESVRGALRGIADVRGHSVHASSTRVGSRARGGGARRRRRHQFPVLNRAGLAVGPFVERMAPWPTSKYSPDVRGASCAGSEHTGALLAMGGVATRPESRLHDRTLRLWVRRRRMRHAPLTPTRRARVRRLRREVVS